MTRRWTKITQDNVDYVYELNENGPVMFAWVDCDGITHYGTWQSFGLSIGTMAKSGGNYYYYPIPKLHKLSQFSILNLIVMIHETDCCNLAVSILFKNAGYDDYTDMSWHHHYRVRDEIYEKHPDLSDDGYYELQKECGGPYETDEVYGFYDEILRYGNKNSWDEYNVICSAPTLAEAATWLRKRGIIAEARYNDIQKSWDPMFFNGTYWERPRIGNYTIRNESYEAAMNIALEYAVKHYISNKTVEETK